MLSEIAHEIRRYLDHDPPADVIVREQALSIMNTLSSSKTIAALNKVVGVSDLYAWAFGNREFDEIPPKTVKKYLTGDANAEKDVVARSLEPHVGKLEYESDDESDAVAVGIAWLMNKGYIPKHPPLDTSNPLKKRRKTK